DRGEFARSAAGGGDALLRRLRLTRQRDVAGRGLVPRGGDADERLMDLLVGEAHGVEVRPVGRALRPFRHMPARPPALVDPGFLDVVWHGAPPGSARRLAPYKARGPVASASPVLGGIAGCR